MASQWRCYCCYAVLLILTTHFISSNCGSSNAWWAVGVTGCGRTSGNSSCPNCARLQEMNVFTEQQESECQHQPALRESLSKGARAAIIDCQRRFNESRWNCSTLYGHYLFGSFVVNNQTRETGVLNAYFSAGAISAISEDCHNQRIPSCPCIIDNPRQEIDNNVVFENCEANYNYSADFFDSFVLNQIDNGTFEGRIDRHNIDIGKQFINEVVNNCRCHGVSGTCTVQTCYRRLQTVSEIGDSLFQRYGRAVHVMDSDGEILNTIPIRAPPMQDDIIYKDSSPNFCLEDTAIGTVGVAHRLCVPNSQRSNDCSSTCCANGYYSITFIKPVEDCKFIWCCDIVCDIVRNETIIEYHCNP